MSVTWDMPTRSAVARAASFAELAIDSNVPIVPIVEASFTIALVAAVTALAIVAVLVVAAFEADVASLAEDINRSAPLVARWPSAASRDAAVWESRAKASRSSACSVSPWA